MEIEQVTASYTRRAESRRYYLKYKERVKENSRIYYQAHKKKSNQNSRSWVKNNPERRKEILHRYYLNHKEQIKAYQDIHRKGVGRESKLRRLHEYRAKKSINGGSHTGTEWLKLLRRFNNECLNCGSKERIEKDHIKPISKGGSNSLENLQPLCRSCNAAKNANEKNLIPYFFFKESFMNDIFYLDSMRQPIWNSLI